MIAALAASDAAGAARVVLVGVDGGAWPLLDRGMQEGALPHLRALRDRGVHARLATVEPVNSPTVWTSLATGRPPADHGVTFFFATARAVEVPTVFERMAARGLRVGLYDWLVTWPPRALPGGFVVPGWLRRDVAVWPPDLFGRADLSPYAYSMEGIRAPDAFVANARRELREKPRRFVRLLDAFALDVGAVTFYALDAMAHRFWHASYPEDFEGGAPDALPRHRDAIPETLAGMDRALGLIAAALAPEDTLLVVSDHGFRADPEGRRRVWHAHLHDWLAAEGLDPDAEPLSASTGFAVALVRVHPGPLAARDALLARVHDALAGARAPDGRALFRVWSLDARERPEEAQRGLLARLEQWVVRRALAWYDIHLDAPAHGWVVALPRDERLDALWPDGELRLSDGTAMPVEALAHPNDFTGVHDPTAIFLAAGPALRRGTERGDLSVLDVAPLLLHLARQPIPDDLPGRLPEELLDPDWLAAHPPRRASAAEWPRLPPREPPAEERGEDDAVRERLRSLGYVE